MTNDRGHTTESASDSTAASRAALTTVVTSADAIVITDGDDPAAPHGYAGELKALLIDEATLRALSLIHI